MRPIGRLPDEAPARRFGDFLYGKGIENQVDPTLHGDWEVWILDDDNIDRPRNPCSTVPPQSRRSGLRAGDPRRRCRAETAGPGSPGPQARPHGRRPNDLLLPAGPARASCPSS